MQHEKNSSVPYAKSIGNSNANNGTDVRENQSFSK